MSEPISTPRPPRPAGTLVVVRPGAGGAPRLLMAERSARLRFAGGAMVFPGGAVDDADRDYARALDISLAMDDLAARIAAIRETIEECGLALAGHGRALSCTQANKIREALMRGESFGSVIADFGLEFDFTQLLPFARWCPPPPGPPRRFDTRFYVAVTGEGFGELAPDGEETAGLGWFSAAEMLDMADRGERRIIFPTRCNLERLACFDTVDTLLDHVRSQAVEMISPWTEMRDGEECLCIPEGHGYPVTSRPLRLLPRE